MCPLLHPQPVDLCKDKIEICHFNEIKTAACQRHQKPAMSLLKYWLLNSFQRWQCNTPLLSVSPCTIRTSGYQFPSLNVCKGPKMNSSFLGHEADSGFNPAGAGKKKSSSSKSKRVSLSHTENSGKIQTGWSRLAKTIFFGGGDWSFCWDTAWSLTAPRWTTCIMSACTRTHNHTHATRARWKTTISTATVWSVSVLQLVAV